MARPIRLGGAGGRAGDAFRGEPEAARRGRFAALFFIAFFADFRATGFLFGAAFRRALFAGRRDFFRAGIQSSLG